MTVQEFQKEHGIIGKSKVIRDLVDILMQVAPSDISILLYGESGVGKEVFADAIHKSSSRSSQKLISVNCGAIPEGILESELFGHKKGSFTGAVDDRKGYFEIADKGTLFLDEIGEMPLTTQVKLLRVLETKEFMPVGSETVRKTDVRIIAATNKDLQKEVEARRFRADLYFRLKAVSLNIPPLRKRKEDIIPLVFHFINNICRNGKMICPEITTEALDILQQYPWPGNVRELKNFIETAAALSKNGKIDTENVITLLTPSESQEQNMNLPMQVQKTQDNNEMELIYRALIEIKKDLIELKQIAARPAEHKSFSNSGSVKEIVSLDKLEKEAIINSLLYSKGNKRKASKLLNISERTLYRKLKEYDIE